MAAYCWVYNQRRMQAVPSETESQHQPLLPLGLRVYFYSCLSVFLADAHTVFKTSQIFPLCVSAVA